MEPLQLRKLRAALNKTLQSRRTVADIKRDGDEFEGLYGPSIWGCYCQRGETFADLYNAHMQRERADEDEREQDNDRADNILAEIGACGVPGWHKAKWFIHRMPGLQDRQEVLDALDERREYLQIPEEE